MRLPTPRYDGGLSVERAIKTRRTVRSYRAEKLSLGMLSQLLWAAQGVTGRLGRKRAAPSAGALYPMDVYAVVGENCVKGVDAGNYHYEPGPHGLAPVTAGDLRQVVAGAALSQKWMARAPINIVITSEYKRITGKYGKRGIRYAMIEAGHIGQNVFLQALSLGLKAGIVGAFHDQDLSRALKLPMTHEPLLVLPVGRG